MHYFTNFYKKKKLDGVGPIDNRSSTDWLHNLRVAIFETLVLLNRYSFYTEYMILSQEGIQPQGRALKYVLNDSMVCYQDLSEYVGLKIIE